MGTVLEIAIKTAFKNFVYQFDGEFFLQAAGGPIGASMTMSVSTLLNESILKEYVTIFENSDSEVVELLSVDNYVDDEDYITQGGAVYNGGIIKAIDRCVFRGNAALMRAAVLGNAKPSSGTKALRWSVSWNATSVKRSGSSRSGVSKLCM